MTNNDRIASGGKWTDAVGGGFGKVVRRGEQPVKLDLAGSCRLRQFALR
jgi:hypothetical protein